MPLAGLAVVPCGTPTLSTQSMTDRIGPAIAANRGEHVGV
jgi:hypothetical protein